MCQLFICVCVRCNLNKYNKVFLVETCRMEKEVGPEVIKATQATLGKYVKRPPLSDKLLKKPPFRFLHDVIISVLKTSGFFEGLFEEEELVSENVKDRDSKISFLNKVISVVALTTGKSLSAKPSKIVAGQEPEKTNELLQCIAYAIENRLSSDEAVKRFKQNLKPAQAPEAKPKEAKPVKKTNDPKKLTSRSSEKLVSTKKESAPVNKNEKSKATDPKSRKKETTSTKTEPQTKKTQNIKTVGKKSSVESITQSLPTDTSKSDTQENNFLISEKDAVPKEATEIQDSLSTNLSIYQEDGTKRENQQKEPTDVREDDTETSNVLENQGQLNSSSYTIADRDLNASLSSQDLMEVNHEKTFPNKSFEIPVTKPNETPEDQIKDAKIEISREFSSEGSVPNNSNFKESEEASASKKPRPALIPKHNSLDSEVKIKELMRNNSQDISVTRQTPEVVARPATVRPSSSRPGAPRLREKLDIVITESENLLLGKVNIIAENSQNEEEEEASVIIVEQHSLGNEAVEGQDMQLSSNEHGHLVQQILNSQKELSQNTGKTEIEWQYGSQKAKEASSQEIEQLRFSIQALSRVANPLGKLLDHIQEDVEVMRQELQQWTKVYEEVSKDMLQQKSESDKALLPLQTRVKQLDVDIEEKRDKINDIKILIHKNTARIDQLLANGNVQ